MIYRVAGFFLGLTVSLVALPAGTPTDMLGVAASNMSAESQWEESLRDAISAENVRENMRRLSAHPHHVGSPYDKDDADWILSRYRQAGFDAHIETFTVLFPTPKVRILELKEPEVFHAALREPDIASDPTTNQGGEQLPTYNAYSADGDVTAPLVYVNYGDREDYEKLERLGVSVKGAIVIARYGRSWRGVKPKVAYEHGAIGCIIYSDPKDDGFFQGDVYPDGPWRPSTGVQRGSVMDTTYPGDPLTPEVGATAQAKRLALKDAKTLTKIPVLPISSADALPLLSALKGPVAPEAWRGALPITYHIGAGPAVVHLKVQSNWDLKPVYDVIATLRGGAAADQWVLRGNHFDAWVNGAEDPISGQAVMLEEARVMGELHRQGWSPARTIIFCSWDGEEPGLLGSVEWVETHLRELQQHAVAYVNSDGSDRGFLVAGGTQDLETLVSQAARQVKDPETNLTVFERARLFAISSAKNADERAEVRKRKDLKLELLGDGSDFTAFQDYAGIPTLDLSFGNENDGTQYHSIYDDYAYYSKYVDTDFAYGRALGQLAGTVVLRLADAGIVPVDYTPQAEAIGKYVADLEKLLKDKRDEFTERNLELKEGLFQAMRDPHFPESPPPGEVVPPFINFAPLKNAVEQLKSSAEHYSKALASYQAANAPVLPAQTLRGLNADLAKVSQNLLDAQGLPDRPWYKNQIYAPGAYTGYGAKPMAAILENMDQKRWHEAEMQVPRVAAAITRAAAQIDKAASDFDAALDHPS